MKPAPFTYHDPRTIAEACDLLATRENARPLAGGQSLVPMLNFRAATPDHLVDLNRIRELAYLRVTDSALQVGAMTRQRDLERSAEVGRRCPVLHAALAHVGHRQTRNRGTLGGSLCHLDPSAELANVAALLGATVHAESRRGRRDIAFSEFAAGYLTTVLAPDELLTGVTLPLPRSRHGHAFVEFARRRGDFAIVAVSALFALDAQDLVAEAVVVISGLGPVPARLPLVEQSLRGERPDAALFRSAAAETDKLDAMTDPYVTGAYRKHLARVLTFRALGEAAARAKESAGA
jgi:carbon-monoxide dehydrogenase medium subunit